MDLAPLVERGLRANPGASPEDLARAALFGEGPGGIIAAGTREEMMALSSNAAAVGFLALGTTGGDRLTITEPAGTLGEISLPTSDLVRIHGTSLAERVAS